EGVGHHAADGQLASDAGDVVEVALRIGHVEIRRRWNGVVADGEQGDRELERAGAAEEVAVHRFRGADGQAPRALTENALERVRLRDVVEHRGRAVSID